MSGLKLFSADELKARFKPAFDLDANLAPGSFYRILQDAKFDVRDAYQRVADGVEPLDGFQVPSSLFGTGSMSPIPFQPLLPSSSKSAAKSRPVSISSSSPEEQIAPTRQLAIRSTYRRPRVVEDSDEDVVAYTPSRIKKRSAEAAFATIPDVIDLVDDDSSEGEAPPAKRRSPQKLQYMSLTKSVRSTGSQDVSRAGKSRVRRSMDVIHHRDFNSLRPSQMTPLTSSSEDEEADENDELEIEAPNSDPSSIHHQPTSTPTARHKKPLDAATYENGADGKKYHVRVTPWIHKLGTAYNARNLEVDGRLANLDIDDQTALRDLTTHLEKLRTEAWENQVDSCEFPDDYFYDEKKSRKIYPFVDIDGQKYLPGDCVVVRSTYEPKSSKGKRKQSLLADEIENPNPWYAQIVYLYEDEYNEPMVHLQWFQHGSETYLGELAGPHELFLLTECDDSPLGCIACKIDVQYFSGDSLKGHDGLGPIEKDFHDPNRYFCRLHYDNTTRQFTEIPKFYTCDKLGDTLPSYCACCTEVSTWREGNETKLLDSEKDHRNKEQKGFRYQGLDYKLLDFVYIFNEESPGEVYKIGQITRISLAGHRKYGDIPSSDDLDDDLRIRVRLFRRRDELLRTWLKEHKAGREHEVRDERCLFRTSENIKLRINALDGQCIVRHREHIDDLNDFKNEEDTFWVAQEVLDDAKRMKKLRTKHLVPLSAEELQFAKASVYEKANKMYKRASSLKRGKKLRGMDIFAGCGGLSVGMEMAGVTEISWAVEKNPQAANTFKLNHPKARVFIADANMLLDRAIRREEGEKLEPLLDAEGNVLPDLPRPGEVDFIIGGPPCQGYSGWNSYKRSDDARNSLILMYLAYADFYRPKYFLLENVVGLLHDRLGASQETQMKTTGGIENGTAKLILRALTSIGYQASFNMLQAAEHGVAQSRRRVFFWASQPGYPLPKYPEPQNCLSESSKLPFFEFRGFRTRRSAPHRLCTVGDVVTDLPAFEWKNPQAVLAESHAQREERRSRQAMVKQYEVIPGEPFIGEDQQAYRSAPLSDYQRKLRTNVAHNELRNHVTLNIGKLNVERVCHVSLSPGANYRDIPEMLRPDFLRHRARKLYDREKRYARLDMENIFRACMTTMNPSGKNGEVLHPTQHRIVALREYARAQSFPDWFVFDLTEISVADAIRQVGNGVAPNVGFVLGRELLRVLVDAEEEKGYVAGGEGEESGSSSSKIEKEVEMLPYREKRLDGASMKKALHFEKDSSAVIESSTDGKSIDNAIFID